MKNTEEFTVNSHDEDFRNNMRASAVLRYMQECANLQLYRTGYSYDAMREDGKAYILSKINVSIYENLHPHDKITVQSWLSECHGVVFTRLYKIFRGDELAAEAASVWGLIGTGADRKIYRVTDIDYEHHMDADTVGIDTPRRIARPDTDFTLAGERTVYYSDCDVNGHMNNTNYPDMLFSFTPEGRGKAEGRIVSMKLGFLSEAALGEELKIYTTDYDGVRYFRTVRHDGKVNVEAEFIIE